MGLGVDVAAEPVNGACDRFVDSGADLDKGLARFVQLKCDRALVNGEGESAFFECGNVAIAAERIA